MYTDFCQNRLAFVEYMTKTFWCFSVHSVYCTVTEILPLLELTTHVTAILYVLTTSHLLTADVAVKNMKNFDEFLIHRVLGISLL